MTDLFPETVLTERLRLERLTPENPATGELYEYCREGAPDIEEATEYVSWNPYPHLEATRDFQRRAEEKWDDGDAATYVVRPREGEDAGSFAGNTSLFVRWGHRRVHFGMFLRKPFWGQGYSGERANAMIALSFERLDLSVVVVTHVVGNEKSRKAIERYVKRNGGGFDGTFRNLVVDQDGNVHDCRRYSVTAEEWREATGGGLPTGVQFAD